MYCSKCGKEVKDEALFCSACGNPTVSTSPTVTATNTSIQQDNGSATAIRIATATIKAKSSGLSFLLTFLFGPIGLFYSTISGGLIMLFGIPMVIGIIIGMGGIAVGSVIGILFLVFYWIIGIIWGLIETNNYNSKLLEEATIGEVGSVRSTGKIWNN